MTEVIGVRFKNVGKIYYFDPAGIPFAAGDHAIVETARGVECGEVVMPPRAMADERIVQPLKPVLRAATDEDMQHVEENRRREKEAFRICLKKIAEHGLGMKLIGTEYTFDNNKVLFYFTADGRVDFRELVKDLAAVFRTRIELRQIGVRDEAKMLGGLGVCGKPFCCSTFLGDFQPVSIKMAKEQGLSLNPTKISGTCGRLMCCLKFEEAAYEDLLLTTPRLGAYVRTPDGPGTVCDVHLLTGMLRVRLEQEPDTPPKVYSKTDIRVMQEGETAADDAVALPDTPPRQQHPRRPAHRTPDEHPQQEQAENARPPHGGQERAGHAAHKFRPEQKNRPAQQPHAGQPARTEKSGAHTENGARPPRQSNRPGTPRPLRPNNRPGTPRPPRQNGASQPPRGGQNTSNAAKTPNGRTPGGPKEPRPPRANQPPRPPRQNPDA